MKQNLPKKRRHADKAEDAGRARSKSQKSKSKSSRASTEAVSSTEDVQSKEATPAVSEVKMRKSERRQQSIEQKKAEESKEKVYLAEKYDINLQNSDDSSDEEVLIRTGNIPKHWYDLYDHKGYSVKGKQVEKLAEKDEV